MFGLFFVWLFMSDLFFFFDRAIFCFVDVEDYGRVGGEDSNRRRRTISSYFFIDVIINVLMAYCKILRKAISPAD